MIDKNKELKIRSFTWRVNWIRCFDERQVFQIHQIFVVKLFYVTGHGLTVNVSDQNTKSATTLTTNHSINQSLFKPRAVQYCNNAVGCGKRNRWARQNSNALNFFLYIIIILNHRHFQTAGWKNAFY